MNLSKSNLIAKFYELSYREYPKDVCSSGEEGYH